MTVTSFSFSLPAAPVSSTAIGPITSGYVDVKHQEVVWMTSTGTAVVYAYHIDQWRTWDVLPGAAVGLVPVTQDVLVYAPANAATASYDLSSADASAQASYETGWVALGGPQDDNQVQEITIQAVRAAGHGVSLAVYQDYDDSAPVKTFVWSATEITALVGAGTRYTLSASTTSMSARSLKLVLSETDAAGLAFRPVSCTIVFGKIPGTYRAGVKSQGRK